MVKVVVKWGKQQFDVEGYSCGKGEMTTNVYFPTSGDGPFPVVLFAHGMDGMPGMGYDKWMEDVADKGFIVIAPDTSGNDVSAIPEMCKKDRDILTALWAAKKSPSPWSTFSTVKADFSNVGVMGHSMGAKHIPTAIEDASTESAPNNIKAAVLSHGGADSKSYPLKIPSFFMTADGDTHTGTTPDDTYPWFDENTQAASKVFVNLKAGGHGEPHTTYQLAEWTGVFFQCHLNSDQTACDSIYGTASNSICQSVDWVDTKSGSKGCLAISAKASSTATAA